MINGVTDAIAQVEAVLALERPYDRVHELTGLCKAAMSAYDAVLREMRARKLEQLTATVAEVEAYCESQKAKAKTDIGTIARDARIYAKDKRLAIEHEDSCTRLDAIGSQVSAWASQQYKKVDEAVRRAAQAIIDTTGVRTHIPPTPQPRTKVLSRAAVCPTKLLDSEEAVDAYVADIRKQLMDALRKSGSVRLD